MATCVCDYYVHLAIQSHDLPQPATSDLASNVNMNMKSFNTIAFDRSMPETFDLVWSAARKSGATSMRTMGTYYRGYIGQKLFTVATEL